MSDTVLEHFKPTIIKSSNSNDIVVVVDMSTATLPIPANPAATIYGLVRYKGDSYQVYKETGNSVTINRYGVILAAPTFKTEYSNGTLTLRIDAGEDTIVKDILSSINDMFIRGRKNTGFNEAVFVVKGSVE